MFVCTLMWLILIIYYTYINGCCRSHFGFRTQLLYIVGVSCYVMFLPSNNHRVTRHRFLLRKLILKTWFPPSFLQNDIFMKPKDRNCQICWVKGKQIVLNINVIILTRSDSDVTENKKMVSSPSTVFCLNVKNSLN